MREVIRQSILSLAVAAIGLFAAACAGSQAASLTAPSSAVTTTAAPGSNIVSGATISGTVVGTPTSLSAGRVSALGTKVEVKGTKQTSGVVLAGSVQVDK